MGSALGKAAINPIFEAFDRFGQLPWFETVSASCLESASIGSAGRRLEALFSGVAGPLSQSTGAVLV